MASEAVLKYLMDTNRPYSCADITVNLRGAFSKSAVQKALDALSDSGKIRCKVYGKQKVYVGIQIDNNEESTDSEDIENQMKIFTQKLSEKTAGLKKAENDLKILILAPTTSAAKKQIDDKLGTIESLNIKLNNLKDSKNLVSADEKKIIFEEHGKLLKEYRKRKRICSDILEAILEGYPKSKKSLLEELCIETDEMVNFKLMS